MGTNPPVDLDAMLDRFQHLPKKIQDYLASLELVELVERMVEQYHLNSDQEAKLEKYIEKIFFKELSVLQSDEYLKTQVLPPTVDAKIFFDELVNAGMFKFEDYFQETPTLRRQQRERAVHQKTLRQEGVLKPSAEDVRVRTGVDFRSPTVDPKVPVPTPTPASALALPHPPAPIMKFPKSAPTLPLPSKPKPVAQPIVRVAAPRQAPEQPPSPQPKDKIHSLLAELQLSWQEDRLKNRFHQVVQTFLSDVRDANETQYYLERSPKIGGLGMKLSIAESIMKILKKEKNAVSDKARSRLNTKKMEKEAPSFFPDEQEAWPMNSEIPEALLHPQAPKPPQPSKPDDAKQVAAPAMNAKMAASINAAEVHSDKKTKILVQSASAKTDLPSPVKLASKTMSSGPKPIPRVRRTPSTSDRPMLVDIKHPKEVMGPIDELRRMSLRDFRDLANNASGSTQKILEKILILEQESVTKKVEGIQAWKASEVNQCYVDIGKASLLRSRAVHEVIRERTEQHLPTLTEEEFTAIIDLNHQLRF